MAGDAAVGADGMDHAPCRRTACMQGVGGEGRDLHTHIWYSRRE